VSTAVVVRTLRLRLQWGRPIAHHGRHDGRSWSAIRVKREREGFPLRCVAMGNSDLEAGDERAQAKTHVAHILQKLGLRGRVQAVVLAYETELVQPGNAPTES
jgi:DNA-binding CsgD family transcriptional regulator